MRKSKYLIMLIGTILAVVIIISAIFEINTQLSKKRTPKEGSTELSQDEYTSDEVVNDESTLETIVADDYTILIRGSARPQNGEITVEEAAKLGVEEIHKVYNIDEKDYSVEMFFLDGIIKDTGTWSGHVILNDIEKYEFLVDGKDGNILSVN